MACWHTSDTFCVPCMIDSGDKVNAISVLADFLDWPLFDAFVGADLPRVYVVARALSSSKENS